MKVHATGRFFTLAVENRPSSSNLSQNQAPSSGRSDAGETYMFKIAGGGSGLGAPFLSNVELFCENLLELMGGGSHYAARSQILIRCSPP